MAYNHNINKNNIERIEASVKWYNPEKGYGFLVRDDHLADVMIHFSALDSVKCPYIKEGDRIVCDIAPTKAGLQVLQVIEVKYGTTKPNSLFSFFGTTSFDPETLEEIEGVIKWYSPERGYGFITPNDGGKEIFLHSTVLYAARRKFLEPGVRVLVKTSTSERGREARLLTILFDEETKEAG